MIERVRRYSSAKRHDDQRDTLSREGVSRRTTPCKGCRLVMDSTMLEKVLKRGSKQTGSISTAEKFFLKALKTCCPLRFRQQVESAMPRPCNNLVR